MNDQTATAFDTEELEKLKASNLMKDFVRKQNGHWDHTCWESFLSSVRGLGYNLPSHVIGAELEVEKTFYWKVKNGELIVPQNAVASAQEMKAEATIATEIPKPLPIQEEPRGPEMPKMPVTIGPVGELENAVMVEEKTGKPGLMDIMEKPIEPELMETTPVWEEKKVEEATRKPTLEENPFEEIDFASLSREERVEYLKSHFKKKIGEG